MGVDKKCASSYSVRHSRCSNLRSIQRKISVMVRKPNKLDVLQQAVSISIAALIMYGVFSAGPLLQAHFLPVVSKAFIVQETQNKLGVVIYVEFTKNYECEFLGINWYSGSKRLKVDFLEDEGGEALSRPPGDQVAGPWQIYNLQTTQGTWATAVHRCALWEVQTAFHP